MLNRSPAALAAALLLGALIIVPVAAEAGGAGLYNGTGFHMGKAFNSSGGSGTWMNEGGGVELFLTKQ